MPSSKLFSFKIPHIIHMNLRTIVFFFSAWVMVSSWTSHFSSVTFPFPWDVFSRLEQLVNGAKLYDNSIYAHLACSLARWGTGYLLAVILGVPLGAILGISSKYYDIVMPLVHMIQLIPGLAWIPIVLLLFGIGETSTVFMITVSALPPIMINTIGGIRTVPEIYIRTARMMGIKPFKLFRTVMIPSAVLSIINGLRIGLGNGWRVLIAAEMIAGLNLGLGYSLIQARWSLDFEASFVCLGLICLVGLIVEKIVFTVIEQRAFGKMGIIHER